MKIIEKLSDMIVDEISGGYDYAKCAVKYKETNSSLSNTFYQISMQEINHVSMLHDEIVKLIGQYRNEHGEPPEGMKALYDYLHEKHIEDVNEIKIMQNQFKG